MNEERRRNLKLVVQIQNEINSRFAEALNELARDKDTDGASEVYSLIGSVIYKAEDNQRNVVTSEEE